MTKKLQSDSQLPKKIDSIDFLRVFGIGIVVLRHSFAPFTGSWKIGEVFSYSESANVLGSYISTISMPLFVFISGFLYCYLRNNLKKYKTYPILVKKKVKRLLIPFLLLSPIYIYFFLDFNSTLEFLNYIWAGPGHLWFLSMIFLLFLLFYPLEPYFKKNILKSIVIILFLFSLSPITHYIGIPTLAKVFKYLPFFYMGYLFHLKNEIVLHYLKGKFFLFFLIHLTLFVFFLILPNYIENRILGSLIAHFKLIPLGIFSIAFIYILFIKLEELMPERFKKPIQFINNNSYYIYLIHEPFLKLFYEIDSIQYLPIYLVIVLGFTTSFMGSLFLGEVILKFKLGRLLIGAETKKLKFNQ
ncbi:acyltransferase family protein [Allomuricauda sp. R78024]|uniref:acyltransferase family protein n=1 Tax=Allomuricauda sp. R78024 TaxID=3093867 RepID=UPI0037C7B27E